MGAFRARLPIRGVKLLLIAVALLWGGWFLFGGRDLSAFGRSLRLKSLPDSGAATSRVSLSGWQACTASSPSYQLQVKSSDLCFAKVRTLLGPDDGRTFACVESNLRISLPVFRFCPRALILPSPGRKELSRSHSQSASPELSGMLARPDQLVGLVAFRRPPLPRATWC